ncbi:UNVERIFIED_CONTAM: hypothetical protein Sradi_3812700 [Sesamum radiatum]|uniref:Uncharacterized protein n=1 Tax=Sesamum radiatum TaxID=300843 RepID=A0AAW2Q0U2_SESRA
MNSVMSQQGCIFTTVQLKCKLSRLHRAWRLLNDLITKGTRWGWDPERHTITSDADRLEELYQMDGTQSGSRRSRDEYEDKAFSQSPRMMSPNEYTSSPQPSQTGAGPSRSGHRVRHGLTSSYNMASSRDEGGPEPNSASASPGTPGTSGRSRVDCRDHDNAPSGSFFDDICMTKPCFYALVDALTSRRLLPHGQTSRDCVGAVDGTLVPVWVPRRDQIRYRSRKGGLAQNVLAICDFDMNFTYVYAGGKVVRPMPVFWTMQYHMTPLFLFLQLIPGERWTSIGFTLDLNIEQRFMWMIADDNTLAPMRDDTCAEAQMGHWTRGLRRYFGYPYTCDQVREKFYEFKRRFDQFHAITQLPGIFYDTEIFVMVFPSELRARASWHARGVGPIRLSGVPVEDQVDAQDKESNALSPARGVDAPIVSNSTNPSIQTHTHLGCSGACSACDAGPRMARSTSLATRHNFDMGSEVGGIGSWTDYIRHFRLQSDRGAQTNSDGDSTHRPQVGDEAPFTPLAYSVPLEIPNKLLFNQYKTNNYC